MEDLKETLEEAAERLYPNGCDGTDRSAEIYRRIFIEGAKWQQKRMYSEEDLREAFRQGELNINYSEMYGLDSELTEKQWFEQFKKNNE